MENINSVSDLKNAISQLEYDKAVYRQILKDSVNKTMEGLKPANVFKNISESLTNPGILANIIPAAIGLGSAFISRKLSNTPVKGSKMKRVLISLALYGISMAVVRNSSISKIFSQRILNSVLN